ncbi:MAG: response regulator [Flavobacteriales bacterium]|jgi:DNA-binding NtrC family response regulator
MNDFASHAMELNALEGKPRVLYLDDDESNLVSFRANFRNHFEIFVATTPVEAYAMMDEHAIQVVITDHQMPTMSGVDFLATLSRDFPNVKRILLTGYSEMIPLVDAINKGKVSAVLSKPFNAAEIGHVVMEAWNQFKELVEQEVLIKQLKRQNQQFEFMLRQRLLS